MTYDVVVIGGGAAGLSGALALARARRSVLVVDAGAPRNAPAGHVHNYLGREGAPPGELLATGRAEVSGYGGEIVSGTVTGLRRHGEDGFEVELSGQVVRARRLLLATGLVDELPPVPGVAERWGRTVLHCPYCHGWEVRDQAIGILGTGPLAVHAALLWRQWSAEVTLFRHTAPEPTAEERARLDARGIVVETAPVAAVEGGADVRLADGRLVPRQALVVTPAFHARTELVAGLGLSPVPMELAGTVLGTHLAAGPAGSTDVPGLYVAGNVADPRGQVLGSAAAGLLAGAAINGDLIEEDTRRAVAGTVLEGAR
ncbi:MAG TPA: NAD(P)/FAD-dependent oxidoreductase [Mycobacteriales bacterium]|nr:NAD(P)/FAD-dependent oxidoreductase [Mycobacteriales bacterium]